MNHPIDFPEMTEAFFDESGLAAFGEELSAKAQDLQIFIKGAPCLMADAEGTLGVSSAISGLCAGGFQAVQMRYAFEGVRWMDTLMRTGDGSFRLIRIRV